jgi:hypothetical protein
VEQINNFAFVQILMKMESGHVFVSGSGGGGALSAD